MVVFDSSQTVLPMLLTTSLVATTHYGTFTLPLLLRRVHTKPNTAYDAKLSSLQVARVALPCTQRGGANNG